METNLEKIKKTALSMVYLDILETNIETIVQHPFTDNLYLFDQERNKFVNILENEETHKYFIDSCKMKINNVVKYGEFSSLITKPYRSTFFKFTEEHASASDAAAFLKDLWLSTETVNVDIMISRDQYVKYFKKYKKEDLMNDEELRVFHSLKKETTIYRGVNEITMHPVDGMSWTLDPEFAIFFAKRFSDTGKIYQAQIDKKNILAYFSLEKETVVDFTKLKNIKLYQSI
jgi:hypothetical protein